eukprot:6177539-Pleurochrysis_carterae.AAC.5
MVSNIRGNRHHLRHSCRSEASDRVGGYIPYIPLVSAYTAHYHPAIGGMAIFGVVIDIAIGTDRDR